MLFHGRLDNVNGFGVNKLIKEGAILAISPNDIINEFNELKENKVINHNDFVKRENKIINHSDFIKKEYRKIYNYLNDIPISLDEIAIKTQNDVKCTLNLLSLMEIEDLVDEIPGARIC